MNNSFVWPSQVIRNAVEQNLLSWVAPADIQPASLDLQLAGPIWRMPASFLPGAGRTVEEYITNFAQHRYELSDHALREPNRGVVLECGSVYLAELKTQLALPENVAARANPKSSSGRLDLFVRLITDGAVCFDAVPSGYTGKLYVEIVPQSFPVRLWKRDTLNQLRFRSQLNAAELANSGLSAGASLPDRAVTVDLDPATATDGIIGYRARRHSGIVDTARRDLAVGDYWEPVRLNAMGGLTLEPEEFYILRSVEEVMVGAQEAAELTAYDIGLGEMRCHYAGFIDPGFGLATAGGAGSRLVLEVRGHDVPFMLAHGQRVGTLQYERLLFPASDLYGRDLPSNYQGQGLKLSKHFQMPVEGV